MKKDGKTMGNLTDFENTFSPLLAVSTPLSPNLLKEKNIIVNDIDVEG